MMRLVLVLALISSTAQAQYWQRMLAPEKARAARLLREGQALLLPALTLGLWPQSTAGLPADFVAQRALALENARVRFELARELDPTLYAARLAYAQVLTMGAGFDDDATRLKAIAELEALPPGFESEQVAFQLGLLHARRGDLPRARKEYERALAMHSAAGKQPSTLLDLAEVTMALGELAPALELYERAARESEGNGRTLALWGSAVVQDRMGDRLLALETARRALASERVPFAALQRAGVFFVPAYERDYYEALGSLALAEGERRGETWAAIVAHARPTSAAVERALEEGKHTALVTLPKRPRTEEPSSREERALLWYLRALNHFERYLDGGGAQGPFAEDAREHLRALVW